MRKKIPSTFGFVFLTLGNLLGQSLPDSTVKKIDSLFAAWNSNIKPGCAIGIVSNGSLIFSKGYGMANLEYDKPNQSSTLFHIASLSKQFTAYAIVLLAKQGKLKLDDDIHQYLGWFPDLKEKITIRNLLNHTSGIRDQWQLLAISGTRLDDVITQDHIIKILGRQKALNAKPGEKFNYSNSGYTMLAEIVKSVTGQTLRTFTDSAIFKPLGMNNTHFHDDNTEIEKNRSYSYEPTDSIHYVNNILNYSNAGATSLFTSVDDMSRWVMNFYNQKVGDSLDLKILTQKTKLNNGKELSYASGIIVDKYRGWSRYMHDGSDAGYRAAMSVFPDLKMGFIVFGNSADINSIDRMNVLSGLFIQDSATHKKEIKETSKDSTSGMLKDTLQAKQFAGHYISEEGLPFRFELKNRKLDFYFHDQTDFLINDSSNVYHFANAPWIKVAFNVKGERDVAEINTGNQTFIISKYKSEISLTDKELMAYTGTYYSPELECRYSIILKGHELVLSNAKYSDSKLKLLGTENLQADYWWMNHLLVKRNGKGKIIGFEINAGRVMHVLFNKID